MYESGDHLTIIAKELGVSVKTLREVIAQQSFAPRTLPRMPRTARPLPDGDRDAMLVAYDHGAASVNELLARYNIPASRLYSELQKAGLAKRKRMPAATSSISEDGRAAILRSYVEGARSIKAIAASAGLNYDQVYVVLREGGVPMKVDRHNASFQNADIRERFRILYADSSKANAEVRHLLGITQHTFNKLVKELQLEPKGKGGGKRSTPGSILEKMPEYAHRYKAGESLVELAKEAGIARSTLKRRLNAL
jgi:DNA-binding phage protein